MPCDKCGVPANLQSPGYPGEWCWKHLPGKRSTQVFVTTRESVSWAEFLTVQVLGSKVVCSRKAYENARKRLLAEEGETLMITGFQYPRNEDIDCVWVDSFEDVLLIR